MRALRSFTVRAKIPEALAPLHELAMNLRWSWDERTRDLFRWVDPAAWEEATHDPVRLLGLVSRERLEALATDPAFMGFLGEVHADLRRYRDAPRWFQTRPKGALHSMAYFSPEFGIAEALPQYSGGLGVLAGDHLKAASGLGLPLVAMALRLVEGASVTVDLAGVPLTAQIWLAQVGRVRLYLLDTDVEDNDAEG